MGGRRWFRKAAKAFNADCGAKWPKAVAKIEDDLDVLLGFYSYPAQHWIRLRTANPIESTFATVRPCQRVTKDRGRGLRGWRWRSRISNVPGSGGKSSEIRQGILIKTTVPFSLDTDDHRHVAQVASHIAYGWVMSHTASGTVI